MKTNKMKKSKALTKGKPVKDEDDELTKKKQLNIVKE